MIVDIDILKPDTGAVHITRPSHSASPSVVDSPELPSPEPERRPYTEPISEGEDDDGIALEPAEDEDKATGLSGEAVAEAIAARKRMLEEERLKGTRQSSTSRTSERELKTDEHAVDGDGDDYAADDERAPLLRGDRRPSSLAPSTATKSRTLSIDPLAPSQAFDETFRSRLNSVAVNSSEQDESTMDDTMDSEATAVEIARRRGDDRELVRLWTAAPGQRIAVPVRIEPKVYFASERTFLVSDDPSPSPPLYVRLTNNIFLSFFLSCTIRNGCTLQYSSARFQLLF